MPMRQIIIVTKYLRAIGSRPIVYVDFLACIADLQCKFIMVYVSFYLKFYLVSSVSVEHCKFMDSKMRPLYLVFKNWDELGDIVRIIFKNGDGECRIFSYSCSGSLIHVRPASNILHLPFYYGTRNGLRD